MAEDKYAVSLVGLLNYCRGATKVWKGALSGARGTYSIVVQVRSRYECARIIPEAIRTSNCSRYSTRKGHLEDLHTRDLIESR